MIVSPGIVRHFGNLVDAAEGLTIDEMRQGTIEEEDSVTERFFTRLVDTIEQHGRRGTIEFHARKLQGRGPDSPEKDTGLMCAAS